MGKRYSSRHNALRRVLLPEISLSKGTEVALPESQVRHLRQTLRLGEGDSIEVTDGKGHLFEAVLKKKQSTLSVEVSADIIGHGAEVHENPTVLLLGLPKNNTMSWVVEKAVECGVTQIIPVQTARSVVHVDPDDCQKYVERWQTIADAAVEQCERLWRPTVAAPCPILEFLRPGCLAAFSRWIFVSELRGEWSPNEMNHGLSEMWEKLRRNAERPICVFIGPEGGFTDGERQAASAVGFEEHSLGADVLRCETAVIAALSYVRLARALKA